MRFARAWLPCVPRREPRTRRCPTLGKAAHALGACLLLSIAPGLRAQEAPVRLPTPKEPAASGQASLAAQARSGLPAPEGFRQYVVQGKLTLTLEAAIRLALANNTDVRIDLGPIDTARNGIESASARFDPSVTSSFDATRSISPSYTQLAGAPTVSSLNQNANVGFSETLESGTSVQASVSANKASSNSVFNFINPSISGGVNLSFTQPLLAGRGFFVNRAPIAIAQRNLNQARDNFEAEINGIIQGVVTGYWSVVGARENLAVQKKSLAEAQQSYDRDKRSLELGALSPLDIYSSQSQVASDRVAVIQAQYALMEAEDGFRNAIGADLDPAIRALDLDLTDNPEPTGTLMAIDFPTALEKALANRPEVAALREQLLNDETSLRLAHNGLLPNLSLTGTVSGSGVTGDEFNTAVTPPVLVASGGFGDALHQAFGFGSPTYGGGFRLTLPLRNRAAHAALGNALVSQRTDLYSERSLRQTITLGVANAVHNLEGSKLSMEAAKIAYNLAQKNLEAQQRKYELGAGEIQFVLQAQTQVAQAEQSEVNSEIGYQNAVTSVEYATGDLLARYQVQIEALAR